MARPDYVSDQDEARERAIAEDLRDRLGMDEVVKNHRFHQADLTLIKDGRVRSLAEIKWRNCSHDTYETVFLAVEKAAHMANYARVSGLPILMIWCFDDGLYGFAIRPDWVSPGWQVQMTGRKDRGDPADIEPVFLIPTSYIKKLKEPS